MPPETAAPLHTADGIELAADEWLPDEPALAAVVLIHGFTAHRRHPAVSALSIALCENRFAVVAYDARGHGTSGGVCTLGDDERADVAAAVEVARQIHPNVVLVGASMGAIAALRFAAGRDDLHGVVTVSCPARWQLHSLSAGLAALLTRTPVGRWWLRQAQGVRVSPTWRRPEPPESLARRVQCPLAVVHGLADRFLPTLEASRLHESATSPRRIDLVAGMGHAYGPAAIDPILTAVRWCLDPDTAGPPDHER